MSQQFDCHIFFFLCAKKRSQSENGLAADYPEESWALFQWYSDYWNGKILILIRVSQDWKTVCLKLAIVNFWMTYFSWEALIYSYYKQRFIFFIEIRHNVFIQCHRNCIEVVKTIAYLKLAF